MIISIKKHKEKIRSYEEQIKILNIKNDELETFKNNEIEKDEVIADLSIENKELKTKVSILETFIKFEYNKEIARLEEIKRRTKKFRIKKKCESRILKYKDRLLAFN